MSYKKKYVFEGTKNNLHVSEEEGVIKFHPEMLFPYYIRRDDLLIAVRDYLDYLLEVKE
jgi:hypothetical protein